MTTPPFTDLLELQRLDTSLEQHRHRLSHLPEAAALAALHEQRAAVVARRAEVVGRRDEVARRQAALEEELAASEARAKVVSARMYSGEVSAARDLQAMAADIDVLKARASDLEDRILEVLDEREPLDAAITADDEELQALDGRLAAAEAARAAAAGTLEREVEGLEAERGPTAARLPDPLLADYEAIRRRSGGIGAARLVGSRCDGCHLTLPAMELDRIKHAPEGTVVHCEECGRILVR